MATQEEILESVFAKISDTAISSCERVKCDFADFVAGLDDVVQAISERADQARDELKQREKNANPKS